MIRVCLAAMVAILLSGMLGCQKEPMVTTQDLMAERNRRVQAELSAKASEKSKENWRTAATGAAASAFVLLVIGAGLGSMSKRDVRS